MYKLPPKNRGNTTVPDASVYTELVRPALGAVAVAAVTHLFDRLFLFRPALRAAKKQKERELTTGLYKAFRNLCQTRHSLPLEEAKREIQEDEALGRWEAAKDAMPLDMDDRLGSIVRDITGLVRDGLRPLASVHASVDVVQIDERFREYLADKLGIDLPTQDSQP
jgi:hypothetical protein